MNICLIGKYPPIAGQVSTIGYWLAEGLAARGHAVTVATNALETDAPFATIALDGAGSPSGAGRSAATVLNSQPFNASQFHIPPDNPIVTKLASLGLQAVREFRCDVILSTYLEPYGIAAHLVSAWTGVPHVQTHAGSDVGRLAAHAQLRPAYAEVVARADRFVAKTGLARSLRVSNDLTLPKAYAPPHAAFNPDLPPLDINAVLEQSTMMIRGEPGWHTTPFRHDKVTIGFYGKLFEAKGVYELIQALGLLKQRGQDFNLLLMTRWYRGEERLRAAIHAADITERTWLLPPLDNRHIGSFIRSCDVVGYLKRDFGTPQHVSIIPDEVLSCGVCLVTSEEVQSTARYKGILRNQDTCLIVQDPRKLDDLVETLSLVIEDSSIRAAVALAGQRALQGVRSYEEFVGSWETLLREAIVK